MYILIWIILGGFIGWFASLITYNDNRMGVFANIIVGLVGSSIGGVLAQLLNIAPLSIFSFWGLVFAVLGAVLLLFFIDLIRNNRR